MHAMPGVTHRMPGIVATAHWFDAPLDHSRPDGRRITLFARSVTAPSREHDDLPWLLFLQGGPGHEAFRPAGKDYWLGRALQDYRVLLLDQRGTGRSTPIDRQTLGRLGGYGPSSATSPWMAVARCASQAR